MSIKNKNIKINFEIFFIFRILQVQSVHTQTEQVGLAQREKERGKKDKQNRGVLPDCCSLVYNKSVASSSMDG
jgi:hypothetical protein